MKTGIRGKYILLSFLIKSYHICIDWYVRLWTKIKAIKCTFYFFFEHVFIFTFCYGCIVMFKPLIFSIKKLKQIYWLGRWRMVSERGKEGRKEEEAKYYIYIFFKTVLNLRSFNVIDLFCFGLMIWVKEIVSERWKERWRSWSERGKEEVGKDYIY